MTRKTLCLLAAIILAGCSSGSDSNPSPTPTPSPPAAATTTVNGTVVDDFVVNSTVTAYAVNASGVQGACIPATPATTPSTCATATTDASGNYTVNLGTYVGAVLLQATGGSYTDTVTGQTVNMPASLMLSALLIVPASSPGSATVTAQITPESTMIAQLAQQQASQGTALATALTNASSAVQGYFGGVSNIAGTALLDLTKTNCASADNQSAAATQASYDASLMLAGIAQLASQYKVTTAQLVAAIIADVQFDGAFDGNGASGAITVPLSGGSGSVALTTIYGSGLAQSLLASITTFESSLANVCQANLSSQTQTALAAAPSPNIAGTFIEISVVVTGLPASFKGNSADLAFTFDLTSAASTAPTTGTPGTTTTAAATFVGVTGNYGLYLPLPYTLSDLAGTYTLASRSAQTDSCSQPSPASGSSVSGTLGPFTVTCAAITDPVSISAGGLASGTSITVQLADTTTSTTASQTTSSASVPLNFGGFNPGDAITLTISSVSQPSSGTQTCVFQTTSVGLVNLGTAYSTTVPVDSTLAISCTTSGGTSPGGPATAINGPGGMVFDANGHLWVTNSDGNGSVLEFSVTLDSSNNATGLIQIGAIKTGLSNPGRLAFDAAGNLYVTNIGTNSVTIYETADSSLSQIGTISNSSIQRPLGVAVDTAPQTSDTGYVYIANNSSNSVSVFSPPAGAVSATNNQFTLVGTLSGDGAGHSYSAPGALSFFSTPESVELALELTHQYNFLFVALGPSSGADSVLMYDSLPLQSNATPFYDLNNGSCSSGPSGPTAVAVSYVETNAAHPVLFYVASYYSNTIAAYDVLSIFENPTTACPVPYATISGAGIAQPEGLAVDAFRNVFVSDASANQITVYNPGAATPSNYVLRFTYTGT
jgi:hypothetical protein